MRRFLFWLLLAWTAAGTASAQLTLPAVIGDHMVLRADTEVKLWGLGFPTSRITVTPSWDGIGRVAVPDSLGRWAVTVRTPKAGEGHSIVFSSSRGKTVEVKDVAVGEVWLCAGQSNMEWGARQGMRQMLEELPRSRNPRIRVFKVDFNVSHTGLDYILGRWEICDSASLYDFGSTAYFFGKELQARLGVPVGLVNASWGGTEIEMWTPPAVYDSLPQFRSRAATIKSSRIVPRVLCGLYNGMVYPLRSYGFSGVIWYQGESNFPKPEGYARLFERMVKEWRRDFGQKLPFYYVQIAPHDDYPKYKGALVMEQQAEALRVLPDAGMIVTTDLVDDLSNIHPQEKREVGKRLARMALERTYGFRDERSSFPSLRDYTVEGERVVLTFRDTYGGLHTVGGEPTFFEIAGADRKFFPARARVDGDRVVVWAAEVKAPVSVRFGFDNEARPNLFGGNGLPAVPFRLDRWDVSENHQKNP